MVSVADVSASPARVVTPSGTTQNVSDMDDEAWSAAIAKAGSVEGSDSALPPEIIASITVVGAVVVVGGVMYIRRRRRTKRRKPAKLSMADASSQVCHMYI